MGSLKKRRMIFCFALLIPAATLYIFSLVVPLVFGTIPKAFYNWNIVKGINKFNGIDNFTRMFTDQTFLESLQFTIVLALFTVVLGNIMSFAIAYMVSGNLYAKSVSRSFFFIPNIMSGILVAFAWLYIFYRSDSRSRRSDWDHGAGRDQLVRFAGAGTDVRDYCQYMASDRLPDDAVCCRTAECSRRCAGSIRY